MRIYLLSKKPEISKTPDVDTDPKVARAVRETMEYIWDNSNTVALKTPSLFGCRTFVFWDREPEEENNKVVLSIRQRFLGFLAERFYTLSILFLNFENRMRSKILEL